MSLKCPNCGAIIGDGENIKKNIFVLCVILVVAILTVAGCFCWLYF